MAFVRRRRQERKAARLARVLVALDQSAKDAAALATATHSAGGAQRRGRPRLLDVVGH